MSEVAKTGMSSPHAVGERDGAVGLLCEVHADGRAGLLKPAPDVMPPAAAKRTAADTSRETPKPTSGLAAFSRLLFDLEGASGTTARRVSLEIAHALREHSRERASQMLASQAVIGVGAAILGIGQAGVDLGNMVAQVTFNLPNSRVQESEADRMGVELAARAGYDPRAAIALWQKMARLGSNGPEFLSTHPSPATRIADLEIHAAKVMPLYEQARARLGLLRGSSGPGAAF